MNLNLKNIVPKTFKAFLLLLGLSIMFGESFNLLSNCKDFVIVEFYDFECENDVDETDDKDLSIQDNNARFKRHIINSNLFAQECQISTSKNHSPDITTPPPEYLV